MLEGDIGETAQQLQARWPLLKPCQDAVNPNILPLLHEAKSVWSLNSEV